MLDGLLDLRGDHLQQAALGCREVLAVQFEHAVRADGHVRHVRRAVVAGGFAVGDAWFAVDEQAHAA